MELAEHGGQQGGALVLGGTDAMTYTAAHAEAMYIPEIYGRSSGATLEVR